MHLLLMLSFLLFGCVPNESINNPPSNQASSPATSSPLTIKSTVYKVIAGTVLNLSELVSGGNPPYSYKMTSGMGSVSSAGIYTSPLRIGTETLSITDISGQKLDITINIPGMNFTPSSLTLSANSVAEVSIDGGIPPFSGVATSGSVTFISESRFSYTALGTATSDLISIKDATNTTKTISVVVNRIVNTASPVISSFTTNLSSITSGQAATLSWSQTGATSLVLNPGNINVTGRTSYPVSPVTNTTYYLNAYNSYGSVTKNLTINITTVPPPPPAPVGTTLSGTYIPEAYAPGCTPRSFTDFMETNSWRNKRLMPKDCELIKIATPAFVWVLPMDRNNQGMTLVITRPSDGYSISRTTMSSRLLLDVALTEGLYEWYVQYTTTSGSLIKTQNRRFVIQKSGQFAIPSGNTIANIVSAKSHPRALPGGADFGTIAALASQGEYKPTYTKFLSNATAFLSTPVPSVPAVKNPSDFANSTEYSSYLLTISRTASNEKNVIETLGYAYYFTGDETYATSAMNRLKSLASWPTNGATSESVQDQANREIYLTLALGLDLFQTKLGSSNRSLIVACLKDRLGQAMPRIDGLDRDPYLAHVLTAVQYVTEALMYASGTPEFPEAKNLLAKYWEFFITSAGTWGGYDGGLGLGGAYGWYSMTSFAHMMAAVKLIANVNLTEFAPFGMIGMNQIAQNPANLEIMSQFGDELEVKSHYFDYSFDEFRLLASVTRKPEYEWYWRVFPRNLVYQTAHQPFHYLMLGAYANLPSAPANTPSFPNSFLFEDAGYVAFHTNTVDTYRSSVFFRSSRLGSENHSHADNNAFTFVSKGLPILISGGYYDSYNSNHHALVTRATRFKNALTFDGGIGQSEPVLNPTAPGKPVFSPETRGKLINFMDDGTWGITTGDATLAYRGYDYNTGALNPLLTNAVRTVAYNRQLGIILVYDWATSNTPRKWELNFQTLFAPTKLSSSKLQLVNSTTSACLSVYGPAGDITTTNSFPVNPDKTFTNQYQSRFSVSTASTQLISVTVIDENCKGTSVTVAPAMNSTSVAVTVNGKVLTFNAKTVLIQ